MEIEIIDKIKNKNKKNSDNGPSFTNKFLAWFRTPDPEKKKGRNEWEYKKFGEKHDIWHEFDLFKGSEWVKLINKKEWYDSPNVPQIYTDHKKILKQNMQLNRPFETWYAERVDDGDFESRMYVDGDGLPSGNGNYRLNIEISLPSGAPSGENNAALVEYYVEGKMKYTNIPGGINFLPRIIAYPLNRFFKWAYLEFIGEEQMEYDGEYVREKVNEYFQYLRKYHGEEPLQAKTRQASYQPSVENGVFFQ